MPGAPYWIVPLFSAAVWLSMLLAMFLTWVLDGKPRYPSMDSTQRIAYISDVGAQRLKPLFIAMSAVVVVTFDVAFLVERWLRHSGRLAQNTSFVQKLLSICASVTAVAGAAGLILLAIFDTLNHPRLHGGFLILFIGGFIVSAVFICAEYQRLGIHYRQYRILRASFWVKLAFILTEVPLAIAFGVVQRNEKWNVAAVLEWVIALIYTFYVASFFLDFLPARHGKPRSGRESEIQMADDESNFYNGGRYGHNGSVDGQQQRTYGIM